MHFTPTPTEPPVFPSPPVVPASPPSDSPPGRRVQQLRSPRGVREGADAPVQSDDSADDGHTNRAPLVRFDGYTGDGGHVPWMPSPVVRVEESGSTDIPMGEPTPLVGREPATSAIAIPSSSLGVVGVGFVPQVFSFNGYEGEYSGLVPTSRHSVLYMEDLYPTALHLFEARKFLDDRPDIAERIRQCERADQVNALSTDLAGFKRRDWDNVALSIVSFFLRFPRISHSALRGRCPLAEWV